MVALAHYSEAEEFEFKASLDYAARPCLKRQYNKIVREGASDGFSAFADLGNCNYTKVSRIFISQQARHYEQ